MRVVLRTRGSRELLEKLGDRLGVTEGIQITEEPSKAEPETPLAPLSVAAAAGHGYPFEELQQSITAQKSPEASRTPETGAAAISQIRSELLDLSELLGASASAGPPPPASPSPPLVYLPLRQKNVALVGFPDSHCARLVQSLNEQSCACHVASYPGITERGVSLSEQDLLIWHAPLEWALTEPLDPGFVGRTPQPVLVCGPRALLIRLARVPQSGPREYMAWPGDTDELVWRLAVLAGRPAPAVARAPVRLPKEKPEILIADEDPTTRSLLATLLTRHGMVCHVAEHGGQTLDLFRTIRPDAAVLDVTMPSMDGFQVLAAIRHDPALSGIPVLFLTSRTAEVDKLQAFALGAEDYMTKPFSPMELAVRLKRMLRRKE